MSLHDANKGQNTIEVKKTCSAGVQKNSQLPAFLLLIHHCQYLYDGKPINLLPYFLLTHNSLFDVFDIQMNFFGYH